MINPDQMAHALETMGLDWADKYCAADALERTLKSVEGKCFIRATGNIEERKAEARNDPEYVAAAEATEAAKLAALKAKVRYDTYKTKAELMRSVESTNRAQMGMR